MTKKLLFVMTILLVATFTLMAADVSGKWTFQQQGRPGGDPVTVTLTLKADGANLTGMLSRPGQNGNMDTEISEGKVDGSNITFSVKMNMRGNEVVTKYEGTLSGDDLKLKMTRPGQDGTPRTTEATAKRATT
jgi:hypothetical protein